MTRIDFYILQSAAREARFSVACRLAEKAVQQRHEVLINTEIEADSAHVDELLWTFSQGSFLPHRVLADSAREDEGEPILIGTGREPSHGSWDLLINLAPEVPSFFSRFSRVAEVVGADEESKAAGRDRFRYYRDRGYELNTHHNI